MHGIIQLCISKYYQNYADVPDALDVRLASERVEVFLSTRWVAVANSTIAWTLENAQVVCRELGYDKNGEYLVMGVVS